jgi:hypothetical protein
VSYYEALIELVKDPHTHGEAVVFVILFLKLSRLERLLTGHNRRIRALETSSAAPVFIERKGITP